MHVLSHLAHTLRNAALPGACANAAGMMVINVCAFVRDIFVWKHVTPITEQRSFLGVVLCQVCLTAVGSKTFQ